MRKILSLLFAAIVLASCKEDDLDDQLLSAVSLPMSGLQEVPAKIVAATGNIDAYYNRNTRTLSYKVYWMGLSGPIVGFHIHGSAQKGVNAPIIQNFSGYSTAVQGVFSGSVLFDGIIFKEEDLFKGQYYINIHTALNPGGEIRGQLENFK